MLRVRNHKYVQLASDLRKKIRNGEFTLHGRLPAERDLCVAYNCSRGTVRQALQHLFRQGIVRTRKGAGSFASGRTGIRCNSNIVTIVPNLLNSELARFVHTLSAELVERGYCLSLKVTNENPETERAIIDELLRRGEFGVLKFPTCVAAEHEVRSRLREAGVPYVVINDFWTDCSQDAHVAYDERAGVRMAVDHLVGLGHRRIGFLDSHVSPRVRAIHAYRDALRDHGIVWDERLILLGAPWEIPALERVYHKGGVNPTAFVTMYDAYAVRLVAGLRQIDLQVPEDVSVANINGEPLAMGHMDFTTAVLPDEKTIAKALELLENWTEGAKPQQAVIKPDFHVGRSTGPCAEVHTTILTEAPQRKEVV